MQELPPPPSSLQVPDSVPLRSATGTLPVGDPLSVLVETIWECGVDTSGAHPPFPLAGEDARRVTPGESCLLLLPLPLLGCIPAFVTHSHPPTAFVSHSPGLQIPFGWR